MSMASFTTKLCALRQQRPVPCAAVDASDPAQRLALEQEGVTCLGLRLGGDMEALCRFLEPQVVEEERQRARRFVHRIDAARHMAGRSLVRRVLAQELGLPRLDRAFTANAWGRPELEGCAVRFSISHAEDMVWAAFARGVNVGIDVEGMIAGDSVADLVDLSSLLHPSEYSSIARLSAGEAHAAFYRCWVRKEAVLKALGEGLVNRPLSSFVVCIDAAARDWLQSPLAGEPEWTTADIDAGPGYQCSVAVMAARMPLVARWASVECLAG